MTDIDIQWSRITHCPGCNSTIRSREFPLTKLHYRFAGVAIPVPRETRIVECASCSLAFKTVVPDQRSLVTLTATGQSELWDNQYPFADEVAFITKTIGYGFSVLDIGAAGGEFLRAVEPISGCRSALDIVRFERLRLSDDGEFMTGFLDDPGLPQSVRQYDVVTAFDVFEHLYSPEIAFKNLKCLVKPNGYALVETGDIGGVARLDLWYYLSLFEHHIGWSLASLDVIAARHGFTIVSVERKFHKSAGRHPPTPLSSAKYFSYTLNPRLYHWLQRVVGMDGSVPVDHLERDHMRVLLQHTGAVVS